MWYPILLTSKEWSMVKNTDLFSFQQRMSELSKKSSPLDRLNVIDWEIFRPILKKVVNKKKGQAGRNPFDVVLKFKILVLQSLYDLSDEQAEFQIKDRFSFMRFLDLDIHDKVPDENTIRVFREQLVNKNLMKKLFEKFHKLLDDSQLISKKGVMIDASIIAAPRQRNSREENKEIKSDKIPEDWETNKAKLAQKDTDARWTKKNNQTFFGYKNHVRADTKSKFIDEYEVTSASVHDSQVACDLLKKAPDNIPIYADSAYSTPDILAEVARKKMKNKICEKGYRNKPLTKFQIKRNRNCSKIRVRVEHVFGDMWHYGGDSLRTIGKARAEFQIGLTNLVYNMRRYEFICR
jgi:IS5 family transposase